MPRPAPAVRDAMLAEFIAGYVDEHTYAPTYREIAAQFDIALQTVVVSLDRLRAAGIVTWEEGRTRTLRIVKDTVDG